MILLSRFAGLTGHRPVIQHREPQGEGLGGRALKGKAGGKFGGCCPFAGNFFAFGGWGIDDLDKGVRI